MKTTMVEVHLYALVAAALFVLSSWAVVGGGTWLWAQEVKASRDVATDALSFCASAVNTLERQQRGLDVRIADLEEVRAWLDQWFIGPLRPTADEDAP